MQKAITTKRDYAAELLFSQAKALIEQANELLARYNAIANTLTAIGYALPEDGFGGDVPVPTLNLTSGCYDYYDAEFLDEYWEAGPIAKRATPIARRGPIGAVRLRLGKEAGWTCFYCRAAGDSDKGPDGRAWHVDHVYPIVRGGDNESDNLVLSCATCNLDKKAKTAAEYFRVLLERRTA